VFINKTLIADDMMPQAISTLESRVYRTASLAARQVCFMINNNIAQAVVSKYLFQKEIPYI
jgi:hypothetical protein